MRQKTFGRIKFLRQAAWGIFLLFSLIILPQNTFAASKVYNIVKDGKNITVNLNTYLRKSISQTNATVFYPTEPISIRVTVSATSKDPVTGISTAESVPVEMWAFRGSDDGVQISAGQPITSAVASLKSQAEAGNHQIIYTVSFEGDELRRNYTFTDSYTTDSILSNDNPMVWMSAVSSPMPYSLNGPIFGPSSNFILGIPSSFNAIVAGYNLIGAGDFDAKMRLPEFLREGGTPEGILQYGKTPSATDTGINLAYTDIDFFDTKQVYSARYSNSKCFVPQTSTNPYSATGMVVPENLGSICRNDICGTEGTIQCNGSCSAIAPPSNFGDDCRATVPNACGIYQGKVGCSGCDTSKTLPSYYGETCTLTSGVKGMKNCINECVPLPPKDVGLRVKRTTIWPIAVFDALYDDTDTGTGTEEGAAGDGTGTGDTGDVPIISSAKDILTFSFNRFSPPVTAEISGNIISATVPYGTDTSSLIPTITTSVGSTVRRVSPGNEGDFRGPAEYKYVVTAPDLSTKEYFVRVSVGKSPDKKILSFEIPNQIADTKIDQDLKTITVFMPYGTSLSGLTPEIGITGASVSPASGVVNNFSSTRDYVVRAADGSTQNYSVRVIYGPAITRFEVPNQVGTTIYNHLERKISINVPYGTSLISIRPSAVEYRGVSLVPTSSSAANFTSPVPYVVTDENGTALTYRVSVSRLKNSEKQIKSFSVVYINEETGQRQGTYQIGDAVIDHNARTVKIVIAYPNTGYSSTNWKSNITISEAAKIWPPSGDVVNLSFPVTYTVTAEDGTKQEYTLTATRANINNQVTSFTIPGQIGSTVINDIGERSIKITMPPGTDVQNLIPSITHNGKHLIITDSTKPPKPDQKFYSLFGINYPIVETGDVQNFSTPVNYAVVSESNTLRYYTVSVTRAPNTSKEITSFEVRGQIGSSVIDPVAKTIKVLMPYGTSGSITPVVSHTGVSYSPAFVPSIADYLNVGRNTLTYTVYAEDKSYQYYRVYFDIAKSSAKDLVTFQISGQTEPTTVDRVGNTVSIKMPYGTNLSTLSLPIVSVSPQATYTRISGPATGFASPVTYRITAADGSYQDFVVVVTTALNPAKSIESFSINGQVGNSIFSVINGVKEIRISVPWGTDRRSLTPSISYTGASISPTPNTPTNFDTKSYSVCNDLGNICMSYNYGQKYTVTAADGSKTDYAVLVNVMANSAKGITRFEIPARVAPLFPTHVAQVGPTIYDHGAGKIQITMPYGTSDNVLNQLYPIIEHTGKAVSPLSGVVNSWGGGMIRNYTVTAEDGSQKTYAVSVVVAKNTAKELTRFEISGQIQPTSIDQNAKTINIKMPYEASLSSLSPSIITVSDQATYARVAGPTTGFASPVTYRVTAGDGTTADYVVTVTKALNPAKDITSFSVQGCQIDPPFVAAATSIRIKCPYVDGTTPPERSLSGRTTTFTINGKSVTPSSGAPLDYSSGPVVFTVKAEDDTTKQYSATANLIPKFLSFSVAGVAGTINHDTRRIDVELPYETNLNSPLVATFQTVGADRVAYLANGTSYVINSGHSRMFNIGPVVYELNQVGGLKPYLTYGVYVTKRPNPAKDIVEFSFSNISQTKIDGTNIYVTVPHGTNLVNSLTPEIRLNSTEASVQPPRMVVQNFSNPVQYTVTAADRSTKVYTVIVGYAPKLNSLKVGSISGSINEGMKTVYVEMPNGSNISSIIPTIDHTGTSFSPTTAQNFGPSSYVTYPTPITYRLANVHGHFTDYKVSVNVARNSSKTITRFELPGQVPGSTVISGNQITLTMPYGSNLANISPSFLEHTGIMIGPSKSALQIFSSPVKYTVTAEDLTQNVYTVTANVAPGIASYKYKGQVSSNINQATKTISLVLPYGTQFNLDQTEQVVTAPVGLSVTRYYPDILFVRDSAGRTAEYKVTYKWAAAPQPTLNSFTYSPTIIPSGTKATVSWNVNNAKSCQAYGGYWAGSNLPSSGTLQSSVLNWGTDLASQNPAFKLQCTSLDGGSSSDFTIWGSVAKPLPPVVTFYSNPTTVQFGGTADVFWSAADAVSCESTGALILGVSNIEGRSVVGPLFQNTTYSMRCKNRFGDWGYNSFTINVNPQPAPTVSLSANSTSVNYNTGTNVSWSSSGAASCLLFKYEGVILKSQNSVATSGSVNTGNLTTNVMYRLECVAPKVDFSPTYYQPPSSRSGDLVISVNPQTTTVTPPPTQTTTAPVINSMTAPTGVRYDQSLTINYSSTGADSCTIYSNEVNVGTAGQGLPTTAQFSIVSPGTKLYSPITWNSGTRLNVTMRMYCTKGTTKSSEKTVTVQLFR